MSLSALTGLLAGLESLSADNMNNAAGILQYCAKQSWRPLQRGKR